MKTKKPKLKSLKNLSKRGRSSLSKLKVREDKVNKAISTAPTITNETVSEHREEVLGSARKFIYPLKHSRHHFVRLSLGILLAAIVAFFAYSALELYYFQS